jgi:hypothetical protein
MYSFFSVERGKRGFSGFGFCVVSINSIYHVITNYLINKFVTEQNQQRFVNGLSTAKNE